MERRSLRFSLSILFILSVLAMSQMVFSESLIDGTKDHNSFSATPHSEVVYITEEVDNNTHLVHPFIHIIKDASTTTIKMNGTNVDAVDAKKDSKGYIHLAYLYIDDVTNDYAIMYLTDLDNFKETKIPLPKRNLLRNNENR